MSNAFVNLNIEDEFRVIPFKPKDLGKLLVKCQSLEPFKFKGYNLLCKNFDIDYDFDNITANINTRVYHK